jgi:hypothetical protein
LRQRQRTKKQRIYDAEECRIRPDTKGKRQHDRKGEPGMLQQHPKTVTQILNHISQ